MTNWLISLPAWGERCVNHLLRQSLPAIEAALKLLPPEDNVRFLVHTDAAGEPLKAAMAHLNAELLPKPENEPNNHIVLGMVHHDVLRRTRVGEAIAFINSDMMCSLEAFSAARARIECGKKLIMCMGTRTAWEEGDPSPPIGARSRELLAWAWEHRHNWIKGCTWGTQHGSLSPTVLYFPLRDGIVLHAFHLHPFVVVKESEGLSFQQVTIDADLVSQFTLPQIHVVTDADELSFLEMSPPIRDLGSSGRWLDKTSVAEFARNVSNATHRWFFGHRIIISGSCTDMSDVPVCSEILAAIDIFIPPPEHIPGYLSAERQQFLQQQQEERRRPFEEASMFHVSLPAWGERHVQLVCKQVIPALREARRQGSGYNVRIIAYTDDTRSLHDALQDFDCDIRQVVNPMADVPDGRDHELLNTIHKQVLTETPPGHVTVLMCGDIIPSRELFAYGTGAFKNGRRVVASMAMRVLPSEEIPIGVTARELLDWGWQHRHEITESCVWSRMKTTFPNTFFFERGDNVVVHCYHLHPFMLMKDRHCSFIGTVDDDLLANYENHEIEYLQNAEIGFLEISPAGFNRSQYGIDNQAVTIQSAAYFARNTMLAHIRNFSKQIRITGFGEVPESMEITSAIAGKIVPGRFFPPPPPDKGGWEGMPLVADASEDKNSPAYAPGVPGVGFFTPPPEGMR